MDRKFILLSVVSAVLVSSFVISSTSANDARDLITEQSLAFEKSLAGVEQQRLVSTLDSEITPVSFSADQELPCGASGPGCASNQCVNLEDCGYDCEESLFTRQYLLGDMFGARPCLAESGVLMDLQLTQFYQGVSSGGSKREFNYGGKADYMFTFLGGKLGLNEGFTAIMHAETRFGEDISGAAGPVTFPNSSMLYPASDDHVTAITGLIFMQALSENFALTAGKFNLLDLWNMIYPNTGRGIDGFMNLSLLAATPIVRTTNLSINGAGAMVMKDKQIQGALLVYDTNNSSTTAGLSDLFDKGAVVLGYWRFFTELGGRPGSHGFLGNWSSRSYTSLDRSSLTVIPGQGLVWADCCDANRNVRLMSNWMIADGDPNFFRWSGNVTLQANGLIPGRENDTMGAGYFYNELSSNFKQLVSPLVGIRNTQGAELYYNAAITPWFHLTADLQVFEDANRAHKATVLPGVRANLRF
ncbi:MAG: carbohydrate porin [Gimesia sp.]|nr:carbohydrate porin [Gimesia sp.]